MTETMFDRIGTPIGDDHNLGEDELKLLKAHMLLLRIGYNIAMGEVADLATEAVNTGREIDGYIMYSWAQHKAETIREISMGDIREAGAELLGLVIPGSEKNT